MGGDDTKGARGKLQVCNQRAAWLDPRQLELLHIAHHAFAKQEHVAVPAVAFGHCGGDGNGNESMTALKQAKIEQAGTLAETPVGFLKGDHVRVDLTDDFGRSLRIELLVDANAFVDIVGCNDDVAACNIGVERPVARPVPDRSQDGLRYPVWFFLFQHPFFTCQVFGSERLRHRSGWHGPARHRPVWRSSDPVYIIRSQPCLNSNSLHNWATLLSKCKDCA